MDSPSDSPSQSHQEPLDRLSIGFPPPTLEQQEEWNRIGLARLEADELRFQKYMAAMGRDIEKRKADLGIQRLVLQNALLYAKDNTAWLDCSCQFCVLMRYLRQHESLDEAGQRLWQDESYQIARSYLEKKDIKTCKCEFCREMGKENGRQNGQSTINANSSQVPGATAAHGSAKEIKSAIIPVAVKEPFFSTRLPTEYSGAKTMKLVSVPHPPRISKFFPVIQKL
ncbi:hypothetical protein H072_2873 [Dactylellina haptotyla CBS 200.50]|uniref:Uncharacterized protein n=1 Tax=Dactylellina haptotyla (strain CBS 200.50) TaxID=1284197 RepID=S8APN9_DACHA|nr:hypothetical protein H072_2873 [Dactylellina haptotyla CBS 200.50]